MYLFYEDNIFRTTTYLTYGPRLKNKHENHKAIFTVNTRGIQYEMKSLS